MNALAITLNLVVVSIILLSVSYYAYILYTNNQKKLEEEENEKVQKEIDEKQKEEESNYMSQIPIQKDEVYHIGDNVFTFDEAEALCKSMDSELASYDQLIDAYKSGAEWCSYGWSKDKMALYPTQKKTWDKLQKAPKNKRDDCGSPGINGGVFRNTKLKFGANCYGKKPSRPNEYPEVVDYISNKSRNQKKLEKYFKDTRGNYSVLPFNRIKWSK